MALGSRVVASTGITPVTGTCSDEKGGRRCDEMGGKRGNEEACGGGGAAVGEEGATWGGLGGLMT